MMIPSESVETTNGLCHFFLLSRKYTLSEQSWTCAETLSQTGAAIKSACTLPVLWPLTAILLEFLQVWRGVVVTANDEQQQRAERGKETKVLSDC